MRSLLHLWIAMLALDLDYSSGKSRVARSIIERPALGPTSATGVVSGQSRSEPCQVECSERCHWLNITTANIDR